MEIGSNALAVAGTIRAEEIIVEAQPWPDYVFDDDYELRSLEEVERHIQERGHLPGIPSAKEIEEEGLAVAKAQTLAMQKIEELTLYVIDQRKEIEALKEENARLSAVEKRLAKLEAMLDNN